MLSSILYRVPSCRHYRYQFVKALRVLPSLNGYIDENSGRPKMQPKRNVQHWAKRLECPIDRDADYENTFWCNRDLIPIPYDRRTWTWQGYAGYWIVTGTDPFNFDGIRQISDLVRRELNRMDRIIKPPCSRTERWTSYGGRYRSLTVCGSSRRRCRLDGLTSLCRLHRFISRVCSLIPWLGIL